MFFYENTYFLLKNKKKSKKIFNTRGDKNKFESPLEKN